MYTFRLLLLLLSFSLLSSALWSQEKTTLFDSDTLKIESETTHCEMKYGYDLNRTILHIQNKSNDTLNVSWNLNLWFDEVCKTCSHETEEYKMSIVVLPNESLSGSCEQPADKVLQFFHSFDDSNCDIETTLTSFELGQLSVRKF